MSKSLLIINSAFDMVDNFEDLMYEYGEFLNKFDLRYIDGIAKKITYSRLKFWFNKYKMDAIRWSMQGLDIKNQIICFFERLEENDEMYLLNHNDLMCFVRTTDCKKELVCQDHIKITLLVSEFEEKNRLLLNFQEMRKQVHAHTNISDNLMLSRIYEKMADICYKLRLESLATDYYAFSAITAERMEEWRRISYLWYSAYSPGLGESVVDYNDFNTLQHTYPTISFEKWRSFSETEKKARALQYSAYSEDNYNGPVDSYWIYFNAWEEYYTAGILDRAIECLVSATNRYVLAFRQLDPKVMNAWKVALNHPEIKRFDDLILRAFEEIYRNLNLNNTDNADFFYIESKKIEHRKLFQNKKYFSYITVKSWAVLTKYGTSIHRLVALTIIMIHLIFPVAFLLTPDEMSFPECLIVSINVFFSIKFETEVCWIFFLIEIVEILYSYMILVAISTWLLRKFLNNYS